MRRSPLLLLALAGAVGGPARAADHAVQIGDNFYREATVTIAPGDTVTWTNTGLNRHSVSGNGFDSGTILPLRSFPLTFEKAGRYPYGCTFHDAMRGTVIVRGAASSPTSSSTTTSTSTSISTTRRSTSTLPPDGSAVTAPGETTTTTVAEAPPTTVADGATTSTTAGLGLAASPGGGDDTSTGIAAAVASLLLLGVSGGALFLLRKEA